MPMMLWWVLALWSLSMLTEPIDQEAVNRPSAVALASAEVDQWKTFLYIAQAFMQSSPTPLAGSFHWEDLRAQVMLPAALLNRPYPATWRLVVDASGRWLTCTPMSEAAIGMLAQWTTPAGVAMQRVETPSAERFMVLGSEPSLYQICP